MLKLDSFHKHQNRLRDSLKSKGVNNRIITRLCDSGYSLITAISPYGQTKTPCLVDSFYGSKWCIGLTPISTFLKCINGEPIIKPNTPTYRVQNIKQIWDILSTGIHAPFFNKGLMSFRGQTREYLVERSFPNPFMEDESHKERLILPAFWRQFNDNLNTRFNVNPPRSIFQTLYGDSLLYHGIKDWENLSTINTERYGIHNMSDLENFPDPESKEYGRRWRLCKVNGGINNDLPLVEQHYGINTCGLDITFDLDVACFFATHTWEQKDNIATYKMIPDGEHKGVIYAFVFQDPPIKSTRDMVRAVHTFDHITPARPLVQKCALPIFNSYNINEAVADLDAVFYLDSSFTHSTLPKPIDLFPGKSDDPFYAAAMDLKHTYSGISPFDQFIEYRFD
jgi:hypothetical protein